MGEQMASSENWLRDQVVAAHEKIENDKRRKAQYDANFKKASQRALDRIGAFFNKEFGTQSIEELAQLPRSKTDAAFTRFSASFEDEIGELRGKVAGHRTLMIIIGIAAVIGGIVIMAAGGVFLFVGGFVAFVGVLAPFASFQSFPRTPNAGNGNQDLFLALRCQQIAEALRKRVNEKRSDLGL